MIIIRGTKQEFEISFYLTEYTVLINTNNIIAHTKYLIIICKQKKKYYYNV